MTNELFIADTHLPFMREGYLDFCVDVARRFNCSAHYHVGDELDNHALSYHEHDPDGRSPGDELAFAKKQLRPWYKAFPKLKLAIGNHSALPMRKAFSAGIPRAWLRDFREALDAPPGWQWAWSWKTRWALLIHGTGYSGQNAALRAAMKNRQPVVMGHLHSQAGVHYHASMKDCLWGMNVGCGIDHAAYAFAYGKEAPDKPVIGCGIVADGVPMFVPMPL